MSKTKFIYILSQRYSGSTLLSFLLGTHPEISTIGERRKFYTHSFAKKGGTELHCSCGNPFTECEHWNAIKEALSKRIDLQDHTTNPTEFKIFRNKYLQRLAYELLKFSLIHQLPLLRWPFRKKLKNLGEFNRVLIEECLNKDQANVFLDSSKVIDHVLFLSLIPDFDIHVVWLTRDPRAQVNSALKYNNWTVEQATDHWKNEMIKNKYILDKMKVNYTSLNYEALCRNPKDEITSLFSFLKMDSSSFSLDFREQTQHIMGNYNMRLGKDTEIVERKDWQEALSKADISKIEDLTSDYRQYYSEGS